MVSVLATTVLATTVVDRWFEQLCKIGICCFSAKHKRAREKTGCLGNQNNVSEWTDMSIRGLLLQ